MVESRWRVRFLEGRGMFGFNKPSPQAQKTADADGGKDAEAREAMGIQQRSKIAAMFAGRLNDPNEDRAKQYAYYAGIRDECLSRIDALQDEFYRGFATHMLIDACMAAGEEPLARALLVSIRDGFIRDKVYESNPALRPSIA
jgi:hypothetical protein